MSNFHDYLDRQVATDPEFAAEFTRLEEERTAMRAVAEARREVGMSQQQLAAATGVQVANISRIENGTANPTINTLSRLAAGMGRKLELRFV